MKLLSVLSLGVIVFAGIGGDGFSADVEVPPGVVYKTVDAATDAKARQVVKEAFAGGAPGMLKVLTNPVICGPAYWKAIKDDPAISAAGAIPSHFKIPNTTTGQVQALEGATFKEAASRGALAGRLAADVGKEPSIRKLHPDELQIFWAMIPFDIEEPIYILEVDKKRFLFSLRRDDGPFSVFWVDELSSYRGGK